MAVGAPLKELWVLDPTTEPEFVEELLAPRLGTLEGKVMGLLDNRKPNADKVLDMVGEFVGRRYSLAGVVKKRKPAASRGAPQEMLDEMASETDFVIVGVGD